MVTYSYDEKRKNHSTLMSNLTVTHTSGGATPRSTINDEFLKFFNFNHFKNEVLEVGIDATLLADTDPSEILNTIKTRTSLTAYYNTINVIDSENIAVNELMKTLSEKITDYFVMSSVLYKIIYGGASGMDMVYVDEIPDRATDTGFKNVLEAYLESTKALNTTPEDYTSNVESNIERNNTFVSQDAMLKQKEKVFNKEKSNVITLMSKIHKGNKIYNNRRFWQVCYFVMFIIYLGVVVGGIYGMKSNMFTNQLTGSVLAGIGSVLFLIMTLDELIKIIKSYLAK